MNYKTLEFHAANHADTILILNPADWAMIRSEHNVHMFEHLDIIYSEKLLLVGIRASLYSNLIIISNIVPVGHIGLVLDNEGWNWSYHKNPKLLRSKIKII